MQDFRKALEIEPKFTNAHFAMAEMYEVKGKYAEAWQELTQTYPEIARFKLQPGREGYWNTEATAMIEIEKERYVPFVWISKCFAAIGKNDAAFEWLEMAYKNPDDLLPTFIRGPAFDTLRSDPRYAPFMQRIGLPP